MLIALNLLRLQGLCLVVRIDPHQWAAIMTAQGTFYALSVINGHIIILFLLSVYIPMVIWGGILHLFNVYLIFVLENVTHGIIATQRCRWLVLFMLLSIERENHLLLWLVGIRLAILWFVQVLSRSFTLLGQLFGFHNRKGRLRLILLKSGKWQLLIGYWKLHQRIVILQEGKLRFQWVFFCHLLWNIFKIHSLITSLSVNGGIQVMKERVVLLLLLLRYEPLYIPLLALRHSLKVSNYVHEIFSFGPQIPILIVIHLYLKPRIHQLLFGFIVLVLIEH